MGVIVLARSMIIPGLYSIIGNVYCPPFMIYECTWRFIKYSGIRMNRQVSEFIPVLAPAQYAAYDKLSNETTQRRFQPAGIPPLQSLDPETKPRGRIGAFLIQYKIGPLDASDLINSFSAILLACKN